MSSIDSCQNALVAKLREILGDTYLVDEDAIGFPVAGTAYVYRGNAQPEELQADLERKLCHVTVFASAHGERAMMGAFPQWTLTTPPDVDLTASLSAAQLQGGTVTDPATGTITFGGATNPGTMMIFQIGNVYVPFKPTYVVGITLSDVATAAAAAINAHPDASPLVVASAVGAVLTLTHQDVGVAGNSLNIYVTIGGEGQMTASTRRQRANVDVSVWAYDHDSRALISNLIDDGLADLKQLEDADQAAIRLGYVNTVESDVEVKHGVYRRVLRYTVEYVRTKTASTYSVLAALTTVEVQDP